MESARMESLCDVDVTIARRLTGVKGLGESFMKVYVDQRPSANLHLSGDKQDSCGEIGQAVP